MKITYILLFSVGLFLFSCGDKKAAKSGSEQLDVEQIKTIENENSDLENLDKEIEKDIKDIDRLLEEVENI